jgi:molecular chaperone DnaK (HSP70)
MVIIGIDLGTTNSAVYYLDAEDNPVLVTDKKRHTIFPSVVWSAGPGKEIVVGHAAKTRLGQRPAPIVAVKRLMGTNKTVELCGEQVTPVQVSAHILTHLKQLAEAKLSADGITDQIGGVLVTMPAYFDAAPKQDTHAAAVAAFFGGDRDQAAGRLELLLEPEAAAYAYLIEDPRESVRVLVYDLGGGTFDVTILEKSPEAGLIMLKFGGDPHLGGDNIDDRIATWLLYLLRGGKPDALDRILDSQYYDPEKQYTVLQQVLTNDLEHLGHDLRPEDRDLLIDTNPLYKLDLEPNNPEDASKAQELKALAEKAKKDLTSQTVALITKQGAFQDQEDETVDIDFTLSLMDFNRLIGDFIGKTIAETLRVIEDSGLKREQIEQVLLVGGSTRMPIVGEELKKIFACPVQLADPDLIVARGASLRGRDLNPPPIGDRADTGFTVEYPRQTAEHRISLMGRVSKTLSGYEVFVLRDGEELATAPVNGDRFIVSNIQLSPNTENKLHLELTNQDDDLFAETDITIRHKDDVTGTGGSITTVLTKPIRYLGVHGFQPLLGEGDKLPAEVTGKCRRATLDDFIKIPFFEGERFLSDLIVPHVDPSLPIGSLIDLHVVINRDYTVEATATVRATGQTEKVEFEISRIELPQLAEMDEDLEGILEQIENDIEMVRDPNTRAKFNSKVRNLRNEYRRARTALTPDAHNLYTIIGELRKVLIEIANAQVFLEPPLDFLERLFAHARALAGQLKDNSPVQKTDVLEKVRTLERVIEDIWERSTTDVIGNEEVTQWKTIVEEMSELIHDLESLLHDQDASGRERRPMSPEELQRIFLSWVQELREKVAEHQLETQFGRELEEVERAARQVDLREQDAARRSLVQIVEEQLKPLDYKIGQAINRMKPILDPNKSDSTRGNVE